MEPISSDVFLCLLHKVVNMATYGVYSEEHSMVLLVYLDISHRTR